MEKYFARPVEETYDGLVEWASSANCLVSTSEVMMELTVRIDGKDALVSIVPKGDGSMVRIEDDSIAQQIYLAAAPAISEKLNKSEKKAVKAQNIGAVVVIVITVIVLAVIGIYGYLDGEKKKERLRDELRDSMLGSSEIEHDIYSVDRIPLYVAGLMSPDVR